LAADETEFNASVTPSSTRPKLLEDGDRLGRGGQPIEFFDDWFALVQVILFIHKVTYAALSPNDVNIVMENDYLEDMGGVSPFANQFEMQIFLERIKKFLTEAKMADWVVSKSLKFERSLAGL
jgi:hypothetical protein